MQIEEAVIKMDQSRSSKIFLAVFFLIIIFSLGLSYWRIVVMRNYNVLASVDCDPYEERCFVHVCDPDPNVDGECTGDLEEDTWYTKNLNRKAYNIPECSPEEEECKALECEAGEENCFYELCGEANVPEGDTCNDPEQYAKDNPAEEEAECEEGDEECEAGEEEAECEEGDEECAASEDDAECEEGDSECLAEENKGEKESEAACDKETGAVCPVSAEEE
ncbi:MAG: hypothetical protein ACD_15C00031G0009 [uncultured bacterium]|nr:MAG: hypothetical protein ACD_15C00031G0009 [uncultured bacterium]